MTARIKIRRDSAASWANNNPILAAGELGLDTDANQIKVGDGVTNWVTLDYVTSSGGSGFDGTSNLTFATEDIGFYAIGLPQYTYGSSNFYAVAMDSSGTGDIAKTVYALGRYYDNDAGRNKIFVSKRNADDTEAWAISYTHVDGWNVYPQTITFDAANDKLYFSCHSWIGGTWYTYIIELDTSNGSILNQEKFSADQGNYPFVRDLLVDPATGNYIAVGNVWEAPTRQAVTPVDASGTNPVQSYSTYGFQEDDDYSLLVVAKTDFDTLGYYPDNNSEWRMYQQNNGGDSGRNCDRVNEFRHLDTQTDTGTGSGARVNLKYDISRNKWIEATLHSFNGSPNYTYAQGDQIRVLGSAFGGTDGVDDIVLTVRWQNGGGAYGLEFVNIDNQSGTPTPPSVVTDYVRLWFWQFNYSFNSDVGNNTIWDIARIEQNSGFILTADIQLGLKSGEYWDRIESGDVYNDGTNSYLYALGYLDSDDTIARGNRCIVYKVNLTDNTQVWAKAIDMTSDGSQNGDDPHSLTCDNTGSVYISANGYDDSEYYGTILTKLTGDGTMQWQVRVDHGVGSFDSDGKLDYDLDNDKLYLGGDSGAGIRIVQINPNTGATVWSRSIDFTTASNIFNVSENHAQFFAVGSGRVVIGGYSYDWGNTYNGGENFGIIAGIDAGLIAVSTDETGVSGPFTFAVDNWHTTGGTGSGNSRDINAKYNLREFSAVIPEAPTTDITTSANTIVMAPVDIVRSPYAIENVKSITFADGTTQSSASIGIKHKWKSPNDNLWKIVEWNEGVAVRYDQYNSTSNQYFTARGNGSGVDFIAINVRYTDQQWSTFDALLKPNLRAVINGTEYRWSGWSTDPDGYLSINISLLPNQTLPSYGIGDNIEFRWDDPTSLQPAAWFDPSNSPYGMNNFRGAIIHYHAFTDNNSGTFVGTIQYSYDGDDSQHEVTHSEHWQGNNELSLMSFWNFDNGRLYYKNTIPEEEYIMIQWTATMFYGNESYC